ncbi:SDR family oxidoreductase [Pseudonocardia sp.]|uniref:SDR family NAD(P)-dependent oxidoreductase n=1 Tax=Pseudonocardia sp. TaxID=60912 RepID=UPI00260A59CC|nr:SDR family oxidoreductase [Pseudonocardia sp.]
MTQQVSGDEAKARQDELVSRAVSQWGDQVSDRVVVVTGGARGIGRAMIEGLAIAGAKVVAADRTWDGAEQFREQLESSGRGMAVEMDVADDGQIDAACSAVVDRFGTVDVLVNNAALVSETLFRPFGRVPTLETKDSDWEAMFKVNVFGVVKTIRRFIRPMIDQGSGSIVNVVSSGVVTSTTGGAYFGLRPWTVEMPYQATKAAVTALTFYLAEEVRTQGVAVNAFMPGHTRASWFDDTARAVSEQGGVYFMRPAVADHVLPISLFLSAQDGRGATGRLYYIPDWNYDHGFGDYATWLDHALPADMEETYRKLEAASPPYERSGVPHLPFDAQGALFMAAMTNMAAGQGDGGPEQST